MFDELHTELLFNSNHEAEMPSKEQILAWLDRAIATLTIMVDWIPGKIDDFALSFLKWARDDETFLGWLDTFKPPAEGALTMPPEPLVDALRRWNTETGVASAVNPGDFMELVGYILQIVQWIQSRRKQQPAPDPA